MRSRLGGHTKDMVQTMVSTDVMISAAHHPLPHATCHPPNTARHTPPASLLPVPGVCNSTSLWIEHAGGVEFSTGSFGRWKTLSLWKFWLIEDSRSVAALPSTRL